MQITRASKVGRARPGAGREKGAGGTDDLVGARPEGNEGSSKRRVRRRGLSLLAGVGMVLTLTAVAPTSPSGAQPSFAYYYWGTNSMTPKMLFGGCYYRTQYGNFGADAYGIVRMYGGSCGGKELAILIADSQGTRWWSNQQVSSGTDSCGSYFEISTSKTNAYVLGVGFGDGSSVRVMSFQSSGWPSFYAC